MSRRHMREQYRGISKTILVVALMAIFIAGAGVVQLASATGLDNPPAGGDSQPSGAGDNNKPTGYVLKIESWTYGETAKKPSVTWPDGTTGLQEGVDYEFKYFKNFNPLEGTPTDAGNYTVRVNILNEDMANLTGSAVDFKIKKAQLEKPSLKESRFVLTGSEIKVELNGFDGETMDKSGTSKATEAGEYTVNVKLRDTANYEWKDGTTEKVELAWLIEKVKEYEVVEGAEQVYVINKSTEARFKIDAEFNLFAGEVLVDDVKLEESVYKAEEGSTVITLSKEMVDSLKLGEHSFVVNFNDGGVAKTTFTVTDKEETTELPKTSDNIVVYLAIATVATMSIAGAALYLNKR